MVDLSLVLPISSILIKQGVGFYLHQEGPNLGKTSCPLSPVTIRLDAQFGTPYPRSAGFDTDIGAFIESSSMPSRSGRMPFPVFKDGTVTKGALAVGQTLRLGGFLTTACSAVAPTVTSRVIDSNLHVSSELAEQLDPMELSSVNELLDRIAALGVATNYDQVGLKPDLREVNSPQVTHHVAVEETQCGDPSSILRTSYVRIPEPSMPDIRGGEDTIQDLSIKSGKSDNIQDTGSQNPEVLRPPNNKLGEVSDSTTPAHPILSDLSQIRQMPEESVHHYWARFLLVMNRIKDCHEGNAISIFCSNCTDKGILNAVSRRNITRFADLASIVQKYCAMEIAWKTKIKFWDNPALNSNPVRIKRAHYSKTSGLNKKSKPSRGHGTVLERWLDGPCKIHSAVDTAPTHSLRACWILRQVAKIGEDLLIPEVEDNQPENSSTVLTIFETFASNNMRKRTLRSLAEVYQVATINPWSNTAITFNASDEP